mgnify:FL=1
MKVTKTRTGETLSLGVANTDQGVAGSTHDVGGRPSDPRQGYYPAEGHGRCEPPGKTNPENVNKTAGHGGDRPSKRE